MRILFIILLFVGSTAYGQTSNSSIGGFVNWPVQLDQVDFSNHGGLNAPQFQHIDLDLDGAKDLAIFDRNTNLVSCFIAKNGEWASAPEYNNQFPSNLSNFMVLRDYDCDGKVDLFSKSAFGMQVYHNISDASGLQWELLTDVLLSEGTSSNINVQINASDIPAIEDVDRDGDLDILLFDFATAVNITYHQNQSMERNGTCGLELKRVDRNWGGITECDCGVFAYDQTCLTADKITHVSGKTILAYDADLDQDMELIIGEEDCSNLEFLENVGSPLTADFSTNVSVFSSNQPNVLDFPAAFLIDINLDGRLDLVRAPNNTGSASGAVDFKSSVISFSNLDLANQEQFENNNTSFLQDQMFDLGERANATAIDWDSDGDQDLLVAFRHKQSQLALLENIGSSTQPEFQTADLDLFGWSANNWQDLQVQIVDFDFDGQLELVRKTVDRSQAVNLSVFEIETQQLSGERAITADINYRDHPHFADLDQDGAMDMVLGQFNGSLSRWTSSNSTTFSLDENEYLGFVQSLGAIDRRAFVADLNQDGLQDLITSSDAGIAEILWSLDESNRESLAFGDQSEPARLGWKTNVAATDLNGDSMPDLLLGMNGGGLQFKNNTYERPSSSNELSVQLFPNPGNGFIKVRSNAAIDIGLFDYQGKFILGESLSAGLTRRIDHNLAAGVYILQTRSINQRQAYRIIVR